MAWNYESNSIILAFAIITVMLTAKNVEGACGSDWHYKFPWVASYYYPYGSYWDTCERVHYNIYDDADIQMFCLTRPNSDFTKFNLLNMSKCCNTCLSPGDKKYAKPMPYDYRLVNFEGILRCENPVIPTPPNCPVLTVNCGCTFPFTFNGKSYSKCTMDNGDTGMPMQRPWCQVNSDCNDKSKSMIVGSFPARYWSSDYCPSSSAKVSPRCLHIESSGDWTGRFTLMHMLHLFLHILVLDLSCMAPLVWPLLSDYS